MMTMLDARLGCRGGWLMVLAAACVLGSAGQALAENFAAQVNAATFKFFHPDSTSTCFLVRGEGEAAPIYLVTTAHTLERTSGPMGTLVLRRQLENGDWERLDFPLTIREGDKPLWTRHKEHDVAVLRLPDELPVPVSPLPMSCLATSEQLAASGVEICSPLYVLTYPGRFEANKAAFAVARKGIFANSPLLPVDAYPTFLADYVTFSGDSGGPVFIPTNQEQTPLVVGVVLMRRFYDVRTTNEYGEELVHHPMHLGGVLHACFVRQMLEQLEAEDESTEQPTEEPVEEPVPAEPAG